MSKHSLFFSSNASQPRQKYPGITSPISLALPKPIDVDLSKKLEKSMVPYDVFESEEDLAKRCVLKKWYYSILVLVQLHLTL